MPHKSKVSFLVSETLPEDRKVSNNFQHQNTFSTNTYLDSLGVCCSENTVYLLLIVCPVVLNGGGGKLWTLRADSPPASREKLDSPATVSGRRPNTSYFSKSEVLSDWSATLTV